VIWFRNVDARWPFLWEDASQPPGRWHGAGEGPAHYLADTPDGAWAEFLRQEEIAELEDMMGVRRNLWAIELADDEPAEVPRLPRQVLRGGPESWSSCQEHARTLRARGATGLRAPSAALVDGGARGEYVRAGLVEGDDRDGRVLVLFGARPDLRGWLCAADAHPNERLLRVVRLRGQSK
jgi:hypothetical protein